MPPSIRTSRQARPRVALIIETSVAPGREVLRGIIRYVHEHGPWALHHEPRGLDEEVPAWLRRWSGEGIIARVQNRRIARAVAALGTPAVDVLGVVRGAGLPIVQVDNGAIARLAFEHLAERGFRSFAFCDVEGFNWACERLRAFGDAVRARGLRYVHHQLPYHGREFERDQQKLARWLKRLPHPVGIMAAHDPVGHRLLEAAQRARLAVPDQVAVVSVDNDEAICEVCDPPLSSIDPDFEQVGYEAASMLDRIMRRESADAPRVVAPVRLVARSSSDALAVDDHDLAEAVRFIREHACDGINVEDVVRHVPVSRSVLQRRFRAVLGKSIHDVLINARIGRAEQLLARTNLTLEQVARAAGFRHVEYMCAVLKRRLGRTAGQLRRGE